MEENRVLSSIEFIWDDVSSSLSRLKETTEIDLTDTDSCKLEIRVMEGLMKKLFERVAERKEALNSQAPVHRLPNEALVHIFRLSLNQQDYEQAWRRHGIASVCRRWRAVVENSPALWTTINSRDNLASVTRALVKSGNSKLDIVGESNHYDPMVFGSEQRQDAFLKLVTSHCERWRSLDLQLGPSQFGHRDPLNTPKLEYLSLALSNKTFDAYALEPFPILPVGMGRLRYLRLDRVSIRWNGLITPRLSTLILQNIPILLGPSLSQLFDILTACPRLATLHIVAVNGLDRISHTNSINALHLRDLVLISIPTTVVEYIMKFLHGPPSRSDAQQAATLDRCLEYPSTDSLFWATTKRTVLGVSHIVVKKMRNYIRFSSDGQWKLEIDLANMHAVHEMLLWFRDATKICGEKMPPIRLELNEHDYRSDVSTLGLLATLENITHLKFGRSYSQPISAIQYLSRNLELGYNTHSWPFNGLQELYTEYPYRALLWSITEMIRERQTPGGNTVLPTPLRRIILGSEDRTSPDEPFDAFWPNPLQNMLQIATSTGTQIQWYGRQVMADGTLDVV